MGYYIAVFNMKLVAVLLVACLVVSCVVAHQDDVDFSGAVTHRTRVSWSSSQKGKINLRGATCSYEVKSYISKFKLKWKTTVCGMKGPSSKSDKASMAKAFCVKQKQLAGTGGTVTCRFRGKVESC